MSLPATLGGHLRAYSTEGGSVPWDVDTTREFDTVNGIPAKGGVPDRPRPAAAGGYVLVNFGQMPGNLLLAYRVPSARP